MSEHQIVAVCVTGFAVVVILWLTWCMGAWEFPSLRPWFRRGTGDRYAKGLEDAMDSMLDRKVAEWRDDLQAFKDVDSLRAERDSLVEQVDALAETMESARQDVEYERHEIEFKLGLEKRRQEQDAEFAQESLDHQRGQLDSEKEVAVRLARVEAREEALKETAEQQQMFLDKQAELIETLTDALPKAEILARLKG